MLCSCVYVYALSDGMSTGAGYVDGRAHRLGHITDPRPIFDLEEWTIINTDMSLGSDDYDPGSWVGFESLEACQSVPCDVSGERVALTHLHTLLEKTMIKESESSLILTSCGWRSRWMGMRLWRC